MASSSQLPPIDPKLTTAGIVVDPRTQERVVPSSRRPDGTCVNSLSYQKVHEKSYGPTQRLRKELKIRPGFTPVEDVSKFRSSRQVQAEARALPKGHIVGWTPPPNKPSGSATSGEGTLNKNAKKRSRKKKKDAEVEEVPDNWEDNDDATGKDKADADESVTALAKEVEALSTT
jgi:partner of Y14 and mago protein